MENALLNYLYLNLYVNHKPAVLYFHLKHTDAESKHYVSLAEDPDISIVSVRVNGSPWKSFNAEERYVILPAAEDLKMEVTLGKKSR